MWRAVGVLPMLAFFIAATVAQAQNIADDAATHWFYMVRSKPADATRETEYNAWYDGVDIPDVLAVPGFLRARRAVAVPFEEARGTGQGIPDARYVALYDIQTTDIDKSIIDLYVAARKMAALGRLTDDLKVVEANYYRRIAGHPTIPEGTSSDDSVFFYIQKVLCCESGAARDRFAAWYRDTYTSAVLGVEGFRGIDLYELYRIMEVLAVRQEEIPHLLIVHELHGDSAAQAIQGLGKEIGRLRALGRVIDEYVPGEAVLYRQMSDVRAH